MIIAASERARELKQKNRHSERVEHLHSPITALLEIQTGKTIG
jgi:DNA-directed RNA polymerase subunit K/omega